MKELLRALLIFLLAGAFICSAGHPQQQTAPPAAKFSESLLEGNPNFNLAILLQGDLRGNFGPCG